MQNDLNDYLSCEIIINKEKNKAWLGQPHLMKKVEKVFGPLLQNGRKYDFKTPGTPSFNIIRPETEEQKISDEKQKIYRSAVGT